MRGGWKAIVIITSYVNASHEININYMFQASETAHSNIDYSSTEPNKFAESNTKLLFRPFKEVRSFLVGIYLMAIR